MARRTDSPVFGIRIAGCRYTARPSAYALVRDDEGRIAVVRAARGWFLPGGGIEPNEDAEQAVEREAREECGLVIEPRRIVGTATEIVHSPAGHSGLEKESVFVEAVVVGRTTPTEPDHELVWSSPADAIARLSHKSHRWAVGRADSLRGSVFRVQGAERADPEPRIPTPDSELRTPNSEP